MPDYSRPPRHLRVDAQETKLDRLPRCLWTDPARFQPEGRDELWSPAGGPDDYLDWGVPKVCWYMVVLRCVLCDEAGLVRVCMYFVSPHRPCWCAGRGGGIDLSYDISLSYTHHLPPPLPPLLKQNSPSGRWKT
jgi:hypothetical protein